MRRIRPLWIFLLIMLVAMCATLSLGSGSPSRAQVKALNPAKAKVKTEIGVVVHFPDVHGDEAQWIESAKILDDIRAIFGPDTMVRWDYQFGAIWEPFNKYPAVDARARRIVGMLADRGLTSLMEVTPIPFPGSAWWPGYASPPVWGAGITPEMRVWIGRKYAEAIAVYRDELKVRKMKETENAVQFGNEPASGHPGGNPLLPRGTWDPDAAELWRECNDEALYGSLTVVTPALSMQDEPQAALERESARLGFAKWQYKAGALAVHDRFYAPSLGGADYVRGNVDWTGKLAKSTIDLYYGQVTSKSRDLSRKAGVWITEWYLPEGDSSGSRGENLALFIQKVKSEGIANVARVFIYSWSSSESVGFAIDSASKDFVRKALSPVILPNKGSKL